MFQLLRMMLRSQTKPNNPLKIQLAAPCVAGVPFFVLLLHATREKD